MADETLLRQESLKLTIPKAVAVVGIGGVGSWAAYLLALAGVKKLYLWDFDTVAEHNLNRIMLPSSAIDKYKSTAVAEEIIRLRPDCAALGMGNFHAETACLMDQVEWVIATTDTLASRKMVYQWCANHWPTRYIEAAAEGEFGSITRAPADFATDLEDAPGYASVPVWVGPCIWAATMAVAFVLHGLLPDDSYRMGMSNDSSKIEFMRRKED